MGSLKLMLRFAQNQVLPLSKLKEGNYPLFKFFKNNREKLTETLKTQYGVEVLDDLLSKKGYDKIRLYLKYHFNDKVNITELRLKHKTIYNYLGELGERCKVLESMGFQVCYDHIISESELLSKLKTLANDNNVVKLNGKLRNLVRKRAYFRGASIEEYLNNLGYKLFSMDALTPAIQAMKDNEKMSFRSIARQLGVSVATVHKLYYKEQPKNHL